MPSETTPAPHRRIAAVGALLALAAGLAVIVWALWQHPLRLPSTLLLLLVTVVAAWTALVHRGWTRIVAVAVAVAALVGVIVLLDVGSLVRLILVVALAVVATAAARVALGSAEPAPGPGDARRVPPAHRGVLLMNPWSGGGKVERFALVQEAVRLGVTPIVLQRGDDLRELAERAVADGADVIGMAGGDGSQALVADVARRHDLPFVCVPAGTRNHFALDLGLDREDVAAALAAYGDAVERRIDLALVGDRVFVNNASLGVYATVVQSEGYREAKVSTAIGMLPDLVGPGAEPFDLRFTGADGKPVDTADVLLVSNGVYRLDDLRGFGTREHLDAGVLGIVSVTVGREVGGLIAAQASGRLRHFAGYREWTAPEFVVDSGDELVDVGVDGEALRLPTPLRFRCLPGALRVRTPLDAPGAPPVGVAHAGLGKAVGGLFRVAAGRDGQV
ncbi:diacylglycerol/lipid kinase family protein [Pseudonocardia xishanensis]|uniref:DAGKc domain-containing protein n=1 Tax=Pseudonocardia xishanensis TaxID=630995 RepID=A0ABP8S0E0_9PSEU